MDTTPTIEIQGRPDEPLGEGMRPARATRQMVLRRITLWLGLCSLSAGPSLTTSLGGVGEFGLVPQLLGVLTFAVFAGVCSSLPRIRKRTSAPRIRNALLIAYAIRTMAAALPFVLIYPDLVVGAFAVLTGGTVTEVLLGGIGFQGGIISSFISTYLLVLWQGVLLNLAVGVLAFLVWLFQVAFIPESREGSSRSGSPGDCPLCRYDLRQTAPGQPCPECGAPKILRCRSCDRLVDSGEPGGPCRDCGSEASYDPRRLSWIDRVSPVRLGLMVAAAMIWTTSLVLFNHMVLGF